MLNRHVNFSVTFSFIIVCNSLILLFGLYWRYLFSFFVFCHSNILTFHIYFVCSLGGNFQNALLFVLLSDRDFIHGSWTGDVSQDHIEHMLVQSSLSFASSGMTGMWHHNFKSIQILSFLFPMQCIIVHDIGEYNVSFQGETGFQILYFSYQSMMFLLSWINFFLLLPVKGRLAPFPLRPICQSLSCSTVSLIM
jgi:hypothetical protein